MIHGLFAATLDAVPEAIACDRPSNEGRHAYVLVNNREEGTAPMTIQVLVDRLREEPRIHDRPLNAARAFLLASRPRTNAPRSP